MMDEPKVCMDCGSPFVWTVKEQEFWKAKKLQHPPKRCAPCRVKKRGRAPVKPAPLMDEAEE